MASIQTSISGWGGEIGEVVFRFVATQTLKPKFKTGIAVKRDHWRKGELSTRTQAVGTQEQANKNAETNKLIKNLAEHLKTRYVAEGYQYTTTASLGEFFTKECDKYLHPERFEPKEVKPKTLMEIVGDAVSFAKEHKEIDGTALKAGTIVTYGQVQNYLNEFIKYKRVDDFQTDELDTAWYNEFTDWLYQRGLKRNSVGKQVKVLKSILRKGIPMAQRSTCEFLVPRRCKVVRDSADDINAVALNEEQLQVLAEQPLSPKLATIRDQFLLQCATGQRYGDMKRLTAENIHRTENGNRYFAIVQEKTGEPVAIPILPEAEAILSRYGDNMPKMLSNQKYNDGIRDICHIVASTERGRSAGFNEIVTHKHNNGQLISTERFCDAVSSHTARRTFCTINYRRGMPIGLIMAVSGHRDQKVFFSYVREPLADGRKRMVQEFFDQLNK